MPKLETGPQKSAVVERRGQVSAKFDFFAMERPELTGRTEIIQCFVGPNTGVDSLDRCSHGDARFLATDWEDVLPPIDRSD